MIRYSFPLPDVELRHCCLIKVITGLSLTVLVIGTASGFEADAEKVGAVLERSAVVAEEHHAMVAPEVVVPFGPVSRHFRPRSSSTRFYLRVALGRVAEVVGI